MSLKKSFAYRHLANISLKAESIFHQDYMPHPKSHLRKNALA